MEGAVGVPERKGRIVGKSLGAPDTLVVLAEAAVRILEKERREETAVRRGVKRLLNPLRALDREPRKLPLPQLLAAAAHLVERKAVDLVQVAPGARRVDRRNGDADGHLLLLPRGETHPEFQVFAPRLAIAAETFRVVAHPFAALHDAEVVERLGKLGHEINMALGAPALHEFIARDGVVILLAQVGPPAFPPQRMPHVDKYEGVVSLGIGEAQDAAALRRRHFGFHAVVREVHAVIGGRAPLLVVAVPRSVTGVGVVVRTGFELDFPHARHEEEVAQIGNTRTAQMVERESHQRLVRVFVARGGIVIIVVRIGADLDAAERHLRPGIDVAEAVGADQRTDIADARGILGRNRERPQQRSACDNKLYQRKFHVCSRFTVRNSGSRAVLRPKSSGACRAWNACRIPARRPLSGRHR